VCYQGVRAHKMRTLKYKQRECVSCHQSFTFKPHNGNREDCPRCPACHFLSRISSEPNEHGCLFWTGAVNAKGYGVTGNRFSKNKLAHRISWEIHRGPISPTELVLHSCAGHYDVNDFSNRRCCNIEHLRLGTHSDNSIDKVTQGRTVTATGERNGARTKPGSVLRGTKHGKSKLTDDIVRYIRASSATPKQLASELGFSKSAIDFARVGATWVHIEGALARPGVRIHWSVSRPESLLRGVESGMAKLDDDKVRLIRSSSESLSYFATLFSVDKSTISKIRRNLIWKHVV
jgi:hypothetical protein